jgi:Cu+-exporting ATPase
MHVIDPVCGRELANDDTAWTLTFGGETFYFCSLDCHDEFEQHPEEYLDEDLEERPLVVIGEET